MFIHKILGHGNDCILSISKQVIDWKLGVGEREERRAQRREHNGPSGIRDNVYVHYVNCGIS